MMSAGPGSSADGQAETQYYIRSVNRVLDILDRLRSDPRGATLDELTAATEMPKSTAFRYLASLEARRYVERDEEGRYRLGGAFFVQTPIKSMVALVRPCLEEIRDRFDETANFGVLDGGRVLYVEILESGKAMRLAAKVGDRDPIHSTALGKAIAAQLADTEVRRILVSEGMPRVTPETVSGPDVYMDELRAVRKRGWALDNGENEPGSRCLAAGLPGLGLPAAISLSAPAVRFQLDDVETVAAALMGAVARITRSNESSSDLDKQANQVS